MLLLGQVFHRDERCMFVQASERKQLPWLLSSNCSDPPCHAVMCR